MMNGSTHTLFIFTSVNYPAYSGACALSQRYQKENGFCKRQILYSFILGLQSLLVTFFFKNCFINYFLAYYEIIALIYFIDIQGIFEYYSYFVIILILNYSKYKL